MPVGRLRRTKSMSDIGEFATNGLKTNGLNNSQIIKDGLNKLKTFKKKSESELLKNLSVPIKSKGELTEETNEYKENIQKNLHASVSAKLKNIFGMQKSEKEKTRRDKLQENVKNFKTSLKAYECFFKDCLDCAKITKPLLDECDKIYKKLGPKGKGYVEFDESEIENGTDKDYQNYLLKISNKYNFETEYPILNGDSSTEAVPTLSFEKFDFSKEEGTNNLTPYKSRAQRVYNQYREFAKNVLEAVKFELETTFLSKQLMIPTEYEKLLSNIDKTTKIIQVGVSQIEGMGYICKEIEEQKNSVLEILKQLNIELKNLKKFCSARYLLFATLTSDDQFNKATETLISRTGTLILDLSDLNRCLSDGKYDDSLKACKLLNGDCQNINIGFESYKKLKESIDLSKATPTAKNNDKDISGKAHEIKKIKKSCDDKIEELESKIKEREKSIRKTRKESIIKILSSISPMLGSILTTINIIAGLAGVS